MGPTFKNKKIIHPTPSLSSVLPPSPAQTHRPLPLLPLPPPIILDDVERWASHISSDDVSVTAFPLSAPRNQSPHPRLLRHLRP